MPQPLQLTPTFAPAPRCCSSCCNTTAAIPTRAPLRTPIPRTHAHTQPQVKLALSRKLCGLLIGHKGQTVRDFIADSGAAIRVQSLSELTPSDPERTIAISGARDQVR